jgi:signal transduction histidine kinase
LRSWNIVLAIAAAAGLILNGLIQSPHSLHAGDYLLAIAAACPILWRTLAPLPALAAVQIGAVACAIAFDASYAATGMIMLELYTVARLGDRQRSAFVGVGTALVVAGAVAVLDGFDAGAIALRVPLVFMALAAGDVVRSRNALQEAARQREIYEAHEREEESLRRVTDERLRIARELHDTLAHWLVAINVRASVAMDLHDSQDPHAALADVKAASADALRELRGTLGLLRRQDDGAPTAPLDGVDAIAGLVARAREAGLQASLELSIDNEMVPTPQAAAAFRIVQESLTNIARHAAATTASVRVYTHHKQLEIEVIDDGESLSAPNSPSNGFGIRGIAERAEALGGHAEAGPREGGGWRVQAVLPLTTGERR